MMDSVNGGDLRSQGNGGKSNIVLIGMPGVGKSTVGVVLAKVLNYEFVDVDLQIQQRCDKTLQRLIDTLGPQGFIDVENEVILGMNFRRTVISTGGSAIYSHDAIGHLAETSTVVYLRASLDEIQKRLHDFSERGIVMRGENVGSLSDLYEERVPLYERYAEVTVDVDGLDITQSANAVVAALGLN